MSASVAPPRGLLGARGAGLPRPSRPSTALNAVQRSTFRSPADGYGLEVLSAAPAKATSAPPVLFVHGSGHGAWCWAQRFMPYLEGRGFESHAVSLRGQGESDPVAETEALTLDVHSRDLADFIATLRSPPVIVGHSFGGLIVQDYARDAGSKHPPIRAMALLASTPPTGNAEMISRFLKRDLVDSARITWWFIRRTWAKDPAVARAMFFSEDVPQEDLDAFMPFLRSYLGKPNVVDVRKVSQVVGKGKPIGKGSDDLDVLVMGGDSDKVVDVDGLREAAEYFGTTPIVLKNTAHDLMLDTRWEVAADKLAEWMGSLENK